MIKIEHTHVSDWEAAIRGARNPMNSWEKSDSLVLDPVNLDIRNLNGNVLFVEDDGLWVWCYKSGDSDDELNKKLLYSWAMDRETGQMPAEVINKFYFDPRLPIIGPNDLKLLSNLAKAGSDEAKFRRMIVVYVDITAPMYWWKEADTYKVGTVRNSCSTMHKIHAKEFTLEDFSTEYITETSGEYPEQTVGQSIVNLCENYRKEYLRTGDKNIWYALIQFLPSSYNQRATLMLNYEVLANMYHARKNHKLDEWREFCAWIETLPYAKELIIGFQMRN